MKTYKVLEQEFDIGKDVTYPFTLQNVQTAAEYFLVLKKVPNDSRFDLYYYKKEGLLVASVVIEEFDDTLN